MKHLPYVQLIPMFTITCYFLPLKYHGDYSTGLNQKTWNEHWGWNGRDVCLLLLVRAKRINRKAFFPLGVCLYNIWQNV